MFGSEPRPEDDDFLYAVDLFNEGYWWEAHVYWERLWSAAASEDDALFLQGLIQLSAAFVKRREGNAAGEAKLLDRSLEKLRRTRARCGGTVRGVRLDELIETLETGRAPILEVC